MPDWLKIVLLIPIYLVFAPAVGFAIRSNRMGQQIVFFMMVFLSLLHYRVVSTSPGFPQDFFYRGHTRGYECTLMEVTAVMLIFAGRGAEKFRGPWLPPGFWIYLLYCFAAGLSIFNSVRPNFTMMAFVKFTKIAVVAIGAFHFLRQEKDIRFWLRCSAIILLLQALVCLVEKYGYHMYQCPAWFEHQNAMVMFTYMLALPLLAAAMAYTNDKSDLNLYAAGYVAAGICVMCALSRVGIIAFAVGTAMVVLLSLFDKFTARRLSVVGIMGAIGVIGLIAASGTLMNRFNDAGNLQSSMTRQLLNESSRHMLADHPLLGVGWNTYGILMNPPYEYGDNMDEYAQANGMKAYIDSLYGKPISESWYYLVLAETGYLGFSVLMIFILTTVFWSARLIWHYRGKFLGAVAIGLFTGLSLNYLQSTIERVLTQPKNMVGWMICLAALARMEWWRRQEIRGRSPVWLTSTSPAVPVVPVAPAAPRPSESLPIPTQPAFNPTPARVILPPPESVRPKQSITILPPHHA